MSIKRKYGIMLVAAVMAVFVGAGIVSAKNGTDRNRTPESVTVAQSETHDGALYAAGQSLTVSGTVKGDVYCAMQTVTITGTVEGDVVCAAQNIRIDGTVTGDVRVAAQTTSFDGKIDGTVTSFAQSIDVGSAAVIGKDLNGAAASIVISGKVGRDVLMSSQTMSIAGTVERNVGGGYGQLTVLDNARVGGALRYTSEQDATIADGTVLGEVVRSIPQREDSNKAGNFFAGAAVYTFFSMLLIALVIVLVAPRLIHLVTENGVSRLLPSLLVGFFFVFGMPLILMLVAVTVVGIPLAGFAFLAWLLILLLSGPVFGYYLGRVIMQRRSTNPLLIMLVGSTVLILCYFIPILNAFTILAAGTVGSGMIVLSLVNRYQKPVYKVDK